jgi:WD40 repeat protein
MGPAQTKPTVPQRASSFFPFTQAQYIKDHVGNISYLEFIDGERFVSGGDDNRILIHSYEAAQTLFIIEGHSAPITYLYLMNEDFFASGSKDNTVKVRFSSTHVLLQHNLSYAARFGGLTMAHM